MDCPSGRRRQHTYQYGVRSRKSTSRSPRDKSRAVHRSLRCAELAKQLGRRRFIEEDQSFFSPNGRLRCRHKHCARRKNFAHSPALRDTPPDCELGMNSNALAIDCRLFPVIVGPVAGDCAHVHRVAAALTGARKIVGWCGKLLGVRERFRCRRTSISAARPVAPNSGLGSVPSHE
jgi:hypothetical protein